MTVGITELNLKINCLYPVSQLYYNYCDYQFPRSGIQMLPRCVVSLFHSKLMRCIHMLASINYGSAI